jgi:hypothetical protein
MPFRSSSGTVTVKEWLLLIIGEELGYAAKKGPASVGGKGAQCEQD